MEIKEIPPEVLWHQHDSGIMSEDQLLGVLLGFFFRVLKASKDRRPGAAVPVDWHTGLPRSQGSLVPRHRAVWGPELALNLIIPPEDWITTVLYTDEIPENDGKTEDQKEWIALCYKPKYVRGPAGRPMANHRCLVCHEEWEAELERGKCIKCGAEGAIPILTTQGHVERYVPAVDMIVQDAWTDNEVRAVKENTRQLKDLIHRLEAEGLFKTRPRIDDVSELGADHLVLGEDERTMGFKITPEGVDYVQEWGRRHPQFVAQGHTLLDAMGKTFAQFAPQWVEPDIRQDVMQIEEWW